jgi:hypothetical protein
MNTLKQIGQWILGAIFLFICVVLWFFWSALTNAMLR